ncbi:MAG: hypothetical protein K9M75_11225 [Phycisphaerae bacterium]|nr:hypothetical protein [Phycisphaerae bacterium]
MKNIKNLNSLRYLILSTCLVVFVLTLTGCGGSMSETSAERSRRHKQIVGSGLGQIADDVDAILLLDKRSKLTDKLIRDY